MALRRARHGARQPQRRQQLAAPAMNRGDSLKGRAIDTPHPGPRRVHAVALDLSHFRLELLEVERGRRRLAARDRVTSAMDDLAARMAAVDLVVDPLVAGR